MKKDEPIIREKPKKKNNMQTKMIIFLIVVIGILIAVPSYFIASGLREDEFQLRSYQYAEVGTRTFLRELTKSGTVIPREKYKITSELQGEIQKVNIEVGEEVDKEQILVEIDPTGLKENIAKLQEDISEMELGLEEKEINKQISKRNNKITLEDLEDDLQEAKNTLKIQEKLFAQGRISKNELNSDQKRVERARIELENRSMEIELEEKKTEIELQEQRERLENKRDQLAELERQKEYSDVKAPIAGRVLNLEVEEGDTVQKDTYLMEMADMNNVKVEFHLSEDDVERLSEDQRADIRVGGEVVEGYVSYISSVIDEEGIEVHTVLKETPVDLRINATANIRFEVEKRENIPYLPRGNYLTSGEHSFVYIIEDENAYRTEVSYGQYDGNFVEITSGIKEGDQVITSSYEDFKENRQIKIIPEGGRKIN